MNLRTENISAIEEYFYRGCKKENMLGVELEHFVINKDTDITSPYSEVEHLLELLQPEYGKEIVSQGHIVGLKREDADLSLEPAAQLEISIGPVVSIDEIEKKYLYFRSLTDRFADNLGLKLCTVGYQPKSKVDELSLIPKQRYEFMDKYFKTTGMHGKNMMRGSAATQISIDYSSEQDFKKKFRVACVMGPLFALLCDNAGVYEGKEYAGRMLRTSIWNDVDKDRSMLPEGALEPDFGFRNYAEYIYDNPAIFVERENETIYTGHEPISTIYRNKYLTQNEIGHLISMFFPDVRLKNYIEIRMCDSMPIKFVLSLTALFKGLFYYDKNLEELYEKTLHVRNKDVTQTKTSLINDGYDAVVYGERAGDILKLLFNMAHSVLDVEDRRYLEPLEMVAAAETTLRDAGKAVI